MLQFGVSKSLKRTAIAAALFSGVAFASATSAFAQTAPATEPPPAATTAPATTPAPGTPAADGTTAPATAPVLGPDGLPLPPDPTAAPTAPRIEVGPDGKIPLVDGSGVPVTVDGVELRVPPQRAPNNDLILGPDGNPIPVELQRDPNTNNIILGEDGQPLLKSDEQGHDLTPLGMFMQAHLIVKIVMIGLIIASMVSWAILIAKYMYFGALNRRTDAFLKEFRSSNAPLQEMAKNMRRADRSVPMVQMLEAAASEMSATGNVGTGDKREHLTSRISAVMSIAQTSNSAMLGSGMGTLATTGSISPFVGLFGTVWGIMNSFIGIAETNTTNLAVVAPGIAEALFATAIGLFAAIPAVIFYNIFGRKIGAYNSRLENFSGELLVRVSRQLDQG